MAETYWEGKQCEEQKRIYISGPITGVKGFAANFDKARSLMKKKYPTAMIIDPSYLGIMYPGYKHSEYMEMCLILMSNCTHIYMIDGWQHSEGAKEELRYALNRGMEIIGDDM